MTKLYVVSVRFEVVVLATNEDAAEAEAVKALRYHPGDCGDPEFEQAVVATMPEQLPRGWGIPFGAPEGCDRLAASYLPERAK